MAIGRKRRFLGKGLRVMDEKTAWDCFAHSGSVQDYLIYSQCKFSSGAAERTGAVSDVSGEKERPDAYRNRRIGDRGKIHRGE